MSASVSALASTPRKPRHARTNITLVISHPPLDTANAPARSNSCPGPFASAKRYDHRLSRNASETLGRVSRGTSGLFQDQPKLNETRANSPLLPAEHGGNGLNTFTPLIAGRDVGIVRLRP